MNKIKILKTDDIPPEALNRNYTTIVIAEAKEFEEMAQNPDFNKSVGSIFNDGRKHYFFYDKTCYLFKGELDGR